MFHQFRKKSFNPRCYFGPPLFFLDIKFLELPFCLHEWILIPWISFYPLYISFWPSHLFCTTNTQYLKQFTHISSTGTMGKVTSFTIHFEPPQAVFFAGSSICGYVTVNLKKPMKMKGIKVKFTGSLLLISFILPIIILSRYLSKSNEQKASETSLCRYKIPILTYR